MAVFFCSILGCPWDFIGPREEAITSFVTHAKETHWPKAFTTEELREALNKNNRSVRFREV